MPRTSLTILLCLISIATPLLARAEALRPDTLRAVDILLTDYPRATLVDVYKAFCQDHFGPLHLGADPQRVAAYIDDELAQMDAEQEIETPLTLNGYEPAGCGHDYVRVDLGLVDRGIIPRDTLVSRFIRSCFPVTIPQIEAWKRDWPAIQAAVAIVRPDLPGFDQDAARIDSILSQPAEYLLRTNAYALHHSPRYEQAYRPHYRIIHRSLLPSPGHSLPAVPSSRSTDPAGL